MWCLHWSAFSSQRDVFGSLTDLLPGKRRSGVNRIGHPDWVKLSVELNCAPNQNTKISRLLQLQTNSSVCGNIILYKNNHIIVHLTEVLVSYIPKFNALHTVLVPCWNCRRDNFNIRSLLSLVEKRRLDMFFDIWPLRMRAIDWLVWMYIDQLNVSYKAFREWGRPKETTYLP